MISKAALDQNPEMKSEISKFAAKLCRELNDKVGSYMKATVISLVKNLQH